MPLQLNRSKPIIWKSDTRLSIGLDSDAQELEDVTLAQERLLNQLYQGMSNDQLGNYASQFGLDEESAEALLKRVQPSLLESEELLKTNRFGKRFAELIRIEFDTGRVAEEVLAKRAEHIVSFERLGRIELMLIRALAEVGFQTFHTNDYTAVSNHDLGELGFENSQLGVSKLEATRSVLSHHASAGTIEQTLPKKLKPHLRVISATHRVIPESPKLESPPTLAIELGIEKVRVSSVIALGLKPCLYCRDLWEAESNPNFLSESFQLLANQNPLDDAASLLTVTSLAVRNICRALDGFELDNQNLVVDLKNRKVETTNWQFHPNCSCHSFSNQI